jgi:hypothetical protein
VILHWVLRQSIQLLTLLPEPEELCSEALPIGKNRRQVLRKVADVARQGHLALRIKHLRGLDPGRHQGFARLEQPYARRIFDRLVKLRSGQRCCGGRRSASVGSTVRAGFAAGAHSMGQRGEWSRFPEKGSRRAAAH